MGLRCIQSKDLREAVMNAPGNSKLCQALNIKSPAKLLGGITLGGLLMAAGSRLLMGSPHTAEAIGLVWGGHSLSRQSSITWTMR